MSSDANESSPLCVTHFHVGKRLTALWGKVANGCFIREQSNTYTYYHSHTFLNIPFFLPTHSHILRILFRKREVQQDLLAAFIFTSKKHLSVANCSCLRISTFFQIRLRISHPSQWLILVHFYKTYLVIPSGECHSQSLIYTTFLKKKSDIGTLWIQKRRKKPVSNTFMYRSFSFFLQFNARHISSLRLTYFTITKLIHKSFTIFNYSRYFFTI